MLKIYNIKDKLDYVREVAILTQEEWGSKSNSSKEYEQKINNKINSIISNLNNPSYCKLILLKEDILVGFISIFPNDCDEKSNISPWYATMFVKKEYRKRGYSKILNDAILKEAKVRKFNKLYLKTSLINYYEKLGAEYIEDLENGEKLFFFNIK